MKAKRYLRITMISAMLVAVLAFAIGALWAYSKQIDPVYETKVLGYVEQHGADVSFQTAVFQFMGEAGAPVRSARWSVCLVRVRSIQVPADEDVVACRSSAGGGRLTGLTGFPPTHGVVAPDGRAYRLEIGAEIMPEWMMKTLLSLMAVGAAAAWLALATWIWLDARERLARNAAAWLLIGFLTGPVGLAVWLAVRGDPYSRQCPHCGAERVPDTAYCVHCGQSLRAACPACGRRVENGWAHCGACGAPLNGTGGGENRVLADEDRAG